LARVGAALALRVSEAVRTKIPFAIAAACALSFVAMRAHAREPRVDLVGSVDVRDWYLRRMPTFDLGDTTDLKFRTLGPGRLPSTGPQHFLAFYTDSDLVYDDHLVFPMLGIGAMGAIGQSPRVVTSVDGTIVDMHPWTSWGISFLLPGIGYRFKERRWMF